MAATAKLTDFSSAWEKLSYLFSLFDRFGNEPYIGEAVSQMQHAQQAAALAEKEGFHEHVVMGKMIKMITNYKCQ